MGQRTKAERANKMGMLSADLSQIAHGSAAHFNPKPNLPEWHSLPPKVKSSCTILFGTPIIPLRE